MGLHCLVFFMQFFPLSGCRDAAVAAGVPLDLLRSGGVFAGGFLGPVDWCDPGSLAMQQHHLKQRFHLAGWHPEMGS